MSCQIVAVVFEAAGVGTPIAVYFDKELEEDLFLEEVLDVFACLGTDALESGASFADEDALLGIAFAVDDCGYTDNGFFFMEGLHFNFDGVRDFFVVVLQDLLADDLVDKKTL